MSTTSSVKTTARVGARPSTRSTPKIACSTTPPRASTVAATRSIASRARSRLLTLTFAISQLLGPRNWAMVGGSNGYRAALVRRQLATGLTSALPGTAGLPPFIFFSTSYAERHRPGLLHDSSELGHHLGHQTLHLLGVVEHRVEQDLLRTGLCHLARTLRAGGWRPVARNRLQAVQLEERVEAVQRLADSPARAVGVVVDGDVDALADLKAGGVAPCLGERLPHDRHLLGELLRRGRPGTEEAVAVSDGAPQRIGMAGAEPDRGMRLLEWFGLHGCILQLPETPVDVDSRLRPERLHQPQPFVEPGHQTGGIDLKRGKHSMPPSGADADLDPTAAQLVQSAQVLREVNRAVQRGDEHDAAQAYPLGAGGRAAQSLHRAHERHRAERLLQRPGALEAERLGPRHVRPEASRIEFTVRNELRDGDRKSHVWLLPRRFR